MGNFFQNLVIEKKLLFLAMIVSVIAVFLSSITYLVFIIIKEKTAIVEDAYIVARIKGEDIHSAVLYQQYDLINEKLKTLNEKPSIILVCTYDSKQNLIGSFVKQGSNHLQGCNDIKPKPESYSMEWDYLKTFKEIKHNDNYLATIFILSDLSPLKVYISELLQYSLILFLVLIAICYAISKYLQKHISHPIIHLTDVARKIARGKYSINAKKLSSDEIGDLADSFNMMLSEIKKRDKDLKDANDTLEEKVIERTKELQLALNTQERFIDNMNHEIRSPINTIIGPLGNLLHTWNKVDEASRIRRLGDILYSGKRLHILVEDLLDLSKLKSGKLVLYIRKIQLSSLVHSTIKELSPSIVEHNNTIELSICDGEPEVMCDVVKIIRVLRNIINNALKYSDGGKIHIHITQDTLEANIPAVSVSISDEGVGIPEDEIDSIFDQFVESTRTLKREKGIGLGLSICKKLIEKHNGIIIAKNNKNKGSTFTFTLPLKQEYNDNIQPANEECRVSTEENVKTLVDRTIASLPDSGNSLKETDNSKNETARIIEDSAIKVLIADDEPLNLSMLSYIMERMNSDIVSFEDGQAAWEYLQANPDQVDIVILDNMMPGLYGTEIIEKMRSTPSLINVPAILQTGKAMTEEQKSDLESLGVIYLSKPFEDEDLMQMVDNAIKGNA